MSDWKDIAGLIVSGTLGLAGIAATLIVTFFQPRSAERLKRIEAAQHVATTMRLRHYERELRDVERARRRFRAIIGAAKHDLAVFRGITRPKADANQRPIFVQGPSWGLFVPPDMETELAAIEDRYKQLAITISVATSIRDGHLLAATGKDLGDVDAWLATIREIEQAGEALFAGWKRRAWAAYEQMVKRLESTAP